MCQPKTVTPPPPTAPPPVLEQVAPKFASSGDSDTAKKRKGLSRYKVQTSPSKTNKIGGIPKKVGIV